MKDIVTCFNGGLLLSPTKWFFFDPCLCPFAVENSAARSSQTKLSSPALFPPSWSCFFADGICPASLRMLNPEEPNQTTFPSKIQATSSFFASLADQVRVTDFGTALCQALSYLYKAFKELSAFFFLFYTVFPTLSLQLSLAGWKCQVAAVAIQTASAKLVVLSLLHQEWGAGDDTHRRDQLGQNV